MADIFISYSKADRDKVMMLSAYLESEGWTVWWDSNLAAGDVYRDEIMKELAAARAVIVLWTHTSIKSDFVRAEAGRAKADGKLIPVKEGDVEYRDIPLPFGEMHTENLANRELIRAAVVAQLAKPAVRPTALHVATKTLRYQVLTWMGIVGGSITLFTNLGGFLNLAEWAHWLVTYWHDWTSAFWQWCFSFIHIPVPRYWSGLISFLFFCVVISFSQRMVAKVQGRGSSSGVSDAPALRLLTIKTAIAALLMVLVVVSIALGINRMDAFVLGSGIMPPVLYDALTIVYVFSPLIMLVVACRDRMKATCVVVLASLFFWITAFPPLLALPEGSTLLGVAFLSLALGGSAAMLTIAPINALSRRLVFLALGLILLIVLNTMSSYAPGIREWLKPPV